MSRDLKRPSTYDDDDWDEFGGCKRPNVSEDFSSIINLRNKYGQFSGAYGDGGGFTSSYAGNDSYDSSVYSESGSNRVHNRDPSRTQLVPRDGGGCSVTFSGPSVIPDSQVAHSQAPTVFRCHCGDIAPVRSKNERQYVSCGKEWRDAGRCRFFLWLDDSKTEARGTGGGSRGGEAGGLKGVEGEWDAEAETPAKTDPNAVKCRCGIECWPKTCRKQGPNEGRHFFACPKTSEDPTRCNFFKWQDELSGYPRPGAVASPPPTFHSRPVNSPPPAERG
eukprot:CAMPEP_0175061774 /NCGR_PEP_ID=MMETSP0052_2-20121109/13778_1 /TAXON_ID=51329 ORGANISM="Polytomella parva, Strain SAG 63-3" /NCGR_SAMPLE_ID=MMETSP0052_2 /ASSEMBLY_ACC=CAM_ASM_000194 /LENGTH=276 /DNA_ID=CAMNT_0016327679 /DNA_START=186 /DNA_END=1012 /DNA_ORIENTATION=+